MARQREALISIDQDGAHLASPMITSDSLAPAATPFLLEDFAGIATFRGKPIYSQEQVIGQIDAGVEFKGNTITFTFLDGPHTIGIYNNPRYAFAEPEGYSPFSAAEKAVARDALRLWDDLIPQSIVEKNGNGADIVLANTTSGPAQAWAYYPGTGVKVSGDVWTADPSVNWTNDWLQYDGYGRTTLIHELGHSLGLSHPGDYNFGDDGPDPDTDPDPITYLGDAFYAQDSEQYSIMSYFGPQETGAQPVNGALFLVGNAQTPLLHDILTIQAKYGADPTTRAGDTQYFAGSTAGNAVYDLAANPYPYLSVYDAGGVDTFDFSTANRGVFIDLRPGAFSSAAAGAVTLAQANAIIAEFNAATQPPQGDFALYTTQAEVDADANVLANIGANRVFNDTGIAGVGATSHRNISIAYNTIIENANGGSARDYLVGNGVSNVLNGNGGNDVINGLGGDDFLFGGTGSDEFRFFNDSGNDTIGDFVSGTDKIHLTEIDANTGSAGNQNFTFLGNAAFSGAAGQLRTYNEGGNYFVAGDVNGDGVADFSINTGHSLAVLGDFFL
jgi:serralysin